MPWIQHSRWAKLHLEEYARGQYLSTACGLAIVVYPKDTKTETPDPARCCKSCLAWQRRWRTPLDADAQAARTPHAPADLAGALQDRPKEGPHGVVSC